jgi:eukaryotic-like serine/threonine-protein kinase
VAERGLVGATLGRYRVVEELGRGGMAVVYRGEDVQLGRAVAVKVMHAHLESTPEAVERFRREARAVAALKHPNIVEIFDYAASEGPDHPAMIVTELIEGPSLKRFCDQHGSPLPEVAAMIGVKVAGALAAAHQRGIIHRDIKPENLLIDTGGRLVLTDFGIARVTGTETMTETGAMVGSPAYMSPEQARGEDLDPRSDVFSCGTVLYQLATGALPFAGKDALSTALGIIKGDYAPPAKRNPRLGSGLDRIIRKCLQADRTQRYVDAGALAAVLEEVCAEDGLTDLDAELRSYFEDPPTFNRSLEPRVLARALERARRAAADRQWARAMAECNRILAIDPHEREAQAIVDRLGAGQGRRRLLLWVGGAVAVAAFAAAAGLAVMKLRPPAAPRADAAAVAVAPVDASAAVAVDDAAPAVALVAPGPADAATPVPPRPVGPRERPRGPTGTTGAVAATGVVPPRDAGVAVRPRPVDAGAAVVKPALPVAVSLNFLPWCKLSVDGKEHGRVPPASALSLLPGPHRVVCTQRPEGPLHFEKVITVEPGKAIDIRRSLLEPVELRVKLREGDEVRIAGQSYRNGTHHIRPGSHKAQVLKDGAVTQERVVEVGAARPCTLTDVPKVRCLETP